MNVRPESSLRQRVIPTPLWLEPASGGNGMYRAVRLRLRQFDDVAIGVSVPRRPPPRLGPRIVHQFGARGESPLVSAVEILHSKPDLRSLSYRAVFRGVERKVDEVAFGPRRRRVLSTDPSIVAVVILDVKIETEAIAVEP